MELKLDGYRALAIKTGGSVQLRSRNNNDLGGRYPLLLTALASMPDETVIDGELVALNESGRPSFNALQNYGSSRAPVFFYAFDEAGFTCTPVSRNQVAGRVSMAKILDKTDKLVSYLPQLHSRPFNERRIR